MYREACSPDISQLLTVSYTSFASMQHARAIQLQQICNYLVTPNNAVVTASHTTQQRWSVRNVPDCAVITSD
jgi:hypothetical protein